MLNRNVRPVSFGVLLKIYFSTGIFGLGEIFLALGIYLSLSRPSDQSVLFAIVPLLIGSGLVGYKIIKVRKAIRPLKFGEYVTARLAEVNRTNVRHNKRTVFEYLFRYEVNGVSHDYSYKTAKRTNLSQGMTFDLLYDPAQPEHSIIPQLYNLKGFTKS
jgi:hypothetical protein